LLHPQTEKGLLPLEAKVGPVLTRPCVVYVDVGTEALEGSAANVAERHTPVVVAHLTQRTQVVAGPGSSVGELVSWHVPPTAHSTPTKAAPVTGMVNAGRCSHGADSTVCDTAEALPERMKMRRTVPALVVGLLLLLAKGLDSGLGGVTNTLLWGVAYADCLLTGWLLGWLLARLTPRWELPSFVWKWFDFFQPPPPEGKDRNALAVSAQY
jgi:hypothetical protein